MVSRSDKTPAPVYKEKILHIFSLLVNVHRPNLREEVSLWHRFYHLQGNYATDSNADDVVNQLKTCWKGCLFKMPVLFM